MLFSIDIMKTILVWRIQRGGNGMRQLTCEICGGTDLIKDNGVFVCQTCGCKYSVEEARKMMFGEEENAPTGISRPVKVDHSEQIEHYLELSRTAYAGGNGQSASNYADKALELSPKNAEAWIAKMKSVEYLATLGNLRLTEVYELGKKAISCATTADEKERISMRVYEYELMRALDLLKLAMHKMEDTADIRNTYKRFSAINFLTAGQETSNIDSKIVSLYDKIADEARALVFLIPDDIVGSYIHLARLVEECAKQYQYETNALIARYKIYGVQLTDSARRVRESNRSRLQDKANKAKKLAAIRSAKKETERREREAQEHAEKLALYWADHAEEKEQLEAEKADLEEQIKDLKIQVNEINKQRLVKADEIRKQRDKKLPVEERCDEFKKQIRTLEIERDQCGIFKAKEKKELQLKIDSAYYDLRTMQKDAQKEREQYQAELNAQIRKIQTEDNEITDEYKKMLERMNEINKELDRTC